MNWLMLFLLIGSTVTLWGMEEMKITHNSSDNQPESPQSSQATSFTPLSPASPRVQRLIAEDVLIKRNYAREKTKGAVTQEELTTYMRTTNLSLKGQHIKRHTATTKGPQKN